MITVVEPDRATARRLLRALYARGCSARVVHDFPAARRLLDEAVPRAFYVSVALGRGNGADLLARCERDERFATVPGLVRVSRDDSLFARALRRGGLHTVVAPIDVEAVATTLARMERGEEGTLRALLHRSHTLRVRTRDMRRRVGATIEVTRRLGALVRRRRAAAGYAG